MLQIAECRCRPGADFQNKILKSPSWVELLYPAQRGLVFLARTVMKLAQGRQRGKEKQTNREIERLVISHFGELTC